jgi:hypothetical protein
MAQINIANYLNQTTWTIIIFGSYCYLMKKYFIPVLLEKIVVKNQFTNKTVIKSNQTFDETNFLNKYQF